MPRKPGTIIEETLRRRLLQSHFAGARYDVLLDLGCGTRPYLDLYGPACGKTIGADMPGDYFPKERVDLSCTVYDIPLPDGAVDAVLLAEVLHDVQTPDRMFAELRRILKPGADVIITSPFLVPICDGSYDHYRYTRHGLKHLLERNGFTVAAIHPVGGLCGAALQLAFRPWLRGWRFLARRLHLPFLYNRVNPFLLLTVYLPQWMYLAWHAAAPGRLRNLFAYGCIGYVTIARKN